MRAGDIVTVVCEACHDPIVKVGGTKSGLALWDHDGEPADHKVEPKPLCPSCNSFSYEHYQTNWGYGWRCTGCGYDEYCSLGD